jgi:hypothetical protein
MQPVRDGRQGCGRSEKVLCHVSPILDPRVKEDRLRLLRLYDEPVDDADCLVGSPARTRRESCGTSSDRYVIHGTGIWVDDHFSWEPIVVLNAEIVIGPADHPNDLLSKLVRYRFD